MRTRPKQNYSVEIGGKIPPQNIELEEVVLGACLLEKQGMEIAIEILQPESFYKDANMEIFKAAKEVFLRQEPVDILTTITELRKNGKLELAGGPYYVSTLTNRVSSSANTEYHCRIIQQSFMKRQLISLSSEILTEAYDDTSDVFDLTDNFLRKLLNLESGINQEKVLSMADLAMQQIQRIKDVRSGLIKAGSPTPFIELDRLIGGWRGGELYIFAARPGMGKSILGKEAAIKSAKIGEPVLVVNLEMNDSQVFDRVSSGESEIPLFRLRNGELEDYHMEILMKSVSELSKLPIYFLNQYGMNIIRLFRIVRKMVKEKSIKMLVLDYLQLMEGDGTTNNREQEIGKISRGLKGIAKEFNIPVIAFAQLSRAVEATANKIPMLSHLRECIAIDTGFVYYENNVQRNIVSQIKVVSLSNNGTITTMSKNIEKTENLVYRVKLKSGRYVDATKEHPILTTDGYKKVYELTTEDVCILAKGWVSEGRNIPEAKFIGWMIGNGCMYGYNVPSFITNDIEVSNEFVNFIKERFGFYPKDHPHYRSKVYQWDITNKVSKEKNPVTKWMRENELWGKKANSKVIPDWFMEEADEKSICELIAGLWETDGSVFSIDTKQTLKYSTTSEELARQILYLLAKIGIIASIDNGYLKETANFPVFSILIHCSDGISDFSKKISLTGKKGYKLKSFETKRRASNLTNKVSRQTTLEISKMITKGRLQTHGTRCATKAKLIELSGKNDIGQYKWLLNPSIHFDKIISITEIGVKPVFDRNVPKTSNFCVNGIIVHNSGALEQDADVVGFIYRPEVYGIETISANDMELPSENKGLLIISKNRQGKFGDVLFDFEPKTASFKDPNRSEESSSNLDRLSEIQPNTNF